MFLPDCKSSHGLSESRENLVRGFVSDQFIFLMGGERWQELGFFFTGGFQWHRVIDGKNKLLGFFSATSSAFASSQPPLELRRKEQMLGKK